MNGVSTKYDPAEAEKRGAPYKLRLVQRFLRKFPFEDEDDPAYDVAKRFLKQVRESNGYDVDCLPRLKSPFLPKDPVNSEDFFIEVMLEATHFAIRTINAETGKSYEFVKVENVVHTNNTLMFLTIMVKEADAGDGSFKTIRALVDLPYSRSEDPELVEWMYKPLPLAESGEDVAAIPTVVPRLIRTEDSFNAQKSVSSCS